MCVLCVLLPLHFFGGPASVVYLPTIHTHQRPSTPSPPPPQTPPTQKHYRKRRCAVCDARPGQYVAIRDPLGDETRGVYCEFCHFQLHYGKDGHLLHEGFEVFPYLHDD